MDTMLTTSQAAERMGCSRQHVANLCDRGELPFTRPGGRRKIPASALPSASLTVDQQRSLWYHLAVAGELVSAPERVMSIARDNLDRWLSDPANRARPWLEEWRRVLDSGPSAVAAVITGTSQRDADLRQSTPFAGVMPAERRQRVLQAFEPFSR